MQQLITERLERYTDLPYELIQDITRQVMLALDVENALNPVVMSEYNYDAELEREYDRGHYEGRKDGAELMIARLLADGVIPEEHEEDARASFRDMFK